MKKSDYKQEKVFGYVFSVIFLVIAFYYYYFLSVLFTEIILIGIALLLLSVFRPVILKPLNYLWIRFGVLLNKITSPIILGFIYYFLIFFTRIYLRAFNKKLLSLNFDQKAKTYWIPKRQKIPDLRKQF